MKSTICKDHLHFSHLIYLSHHYLFLLYHFFAYNSTLFCLFIDTLGFGTVSSLSPMIFLFVWFVFNEQQMYFRKPLVSRLFCWVPLAHHVKGRQHKKPAWWRSLSRAGELCPDFLYSNSQQEINRITEWAVTVYEVINVHSCFLPGSP